MLLTPLRGKDAAPEKFHASGWAWHPWLIEGFSARAVVRWSAGCDSKRSGWMPRPDPGLRPKGGRVGSQMQLANCPAAGFASSLASAGQAGWLNAL